LIQIAKNSEEGVDFLTTSLFNMEEHLSKLVPAVAFHQKLAYYHQLIFVPRIDARDKKDMGTRGRRMKARIRR
jgi:hypothetical protein